MILLAPLTPTNATPAAWIMAFGISLHSQSRSRLGPFSQALLGHSCQAPKASRPRYNSRRSNGEGRSGKATRRRANSANCSPAPQTCSLLRLLCRLPPARSHGERWGQGVWYSKEGKRGRSSVWLERRPVTSEVAGSNPVVPANPFLFHAHSHDLTRKITGDEDVPTRSLGK